ncbi:MAG: P-II family nitrogen regulator [Elusimicrobiales bacterium]|nr:P-II family nitrogen regulator [Elusimicrobiales bacterium]
MKKIEAVIHENKLKEIKIAFDKLPYGLIIYQIEGKGRGKKAERIWNDKTFYVDTYPKVKIETVVSDEDVEKVVEIIKTVAKTYKRDEKGNKVPAKHSGKIFISEVIDAVRISTGENGDKAL